jgi:excisionase family DNA binding protein
MVDERLLTVEEVMGILRVSQKTVYNYLQSGRLKGFRPGGVRTGWRIPESELERFIREAKDASERSEG